MIVLKCELPRDLVEIRSWFQYLVKNFFFYCNLRLIVDLATLKWPTVEPTSH